MNFNESEYTAIILAADGGGGGTGTGDGTNTGGNPLGSMLPLMIGMFVIFYFMIIRPQRKRQKEAQEMIDNMRVGDSVVSAGGIHGIITNKTDNTVTVRVAPNTKLKFDKSSIGKVTPKDTIRPEDDEDDDDLEEEEEEAPKPKAKKKAAAKKKSARKKKAAKKKQASLRSEKKEFDRGEVVDAEDVDEEDDDKGFGEGFGSDADADEKDEDNK